MYARPIIWYVQGKDGSVNTSVPPTFIEFDYGDSLPHHCVL